MLPKLRNIIKEISNPDLSKKQAKTLEEFVNAYRQTFPTFINECISVAITLDTLNPYISLQLRNKYHRYINTEYTSIDINVPLDTPAKSTITFIGRQRYYGTLDLTQDIPNKSIVFNASSLKAWKNLAHNIRPHLTHKGNPVPFKYDQYDNLPI